MEVKQYLLYKYFSPFGYIVAALYLPTLVVLASYTGYLRTSERENFRCPSSPDSRDDCLVLYYEQYDSPFPLYGFFLLCFVPQLAVCIAYSWCYVKSRVDELEAALKADPENPRRRPRVTTRRVFYSYFLHLLVRLVIAILIVLLQKLAFYPNGFPAKFACVSRSKSPNAIVLKPNATNDNINSTAIICNNQLQIASCAKGIFIVNILFALFVFGEWFYLLLRMMHSKEFTFDSEFCQKHIFNKSETPVSLLDTTSRMKTKIHKDMKTLALQPLIAQPENNRLLEDIFVDLVIYTGRAEHVGDLLERHGIFDIYLKPQRGAVPINNIEELFLPNVDTQDPRKILVVGRAGIGKSLLCRKLSLDWSEGDLLPDNGFGFMFLVQFRWFNTRTTEKISLKQLVYRLCPGGSIDSEVFQYMLDNPEKVLLIFDGLDEFKHHENCLQDEQAQGGNSLTETMPFSALYVKLVKGDYLSGATVLTTCRPTVVQSVVGLHFDRKVEIMGFTPEKVKVYVHKFCARDAEIANRIWQQISSNLELLSFCYIPMNSFIVCSIFKQLITCRDQDSGSSLPTTSTNVFEGALRLFLFNHHPDFRDEPLTKDFLMGNVSFEESIDNTLSQVGSLAKTGIEEGRLLFDSKEVKQVGNCGLFNRICMSDTKIPFRVKPHFCFIHLTLQELLAAREISKMDPSDLSDFIFSHASDPKWHMVIQFVAGLLQDQKNEAVNSFVSLLCDSLTEEPPLKGETKQKILLMMKCLHEYNNETLVKEAASELQKNSKFSNRIDLFACQVTPVDCTAIAFFIKHLHELTELNLSYNNITAQGVPHLCKALKDVNCKLTLLNLGHNSIKDQGVSHLCDALKNVNCKITVSNLSCNSITDQGVSRLCDALNAVNCKLTALNLSCNRITDQGVSHLCDALKDVNCKLTELNLAINIKITDKGVSLLCDALKDVNCKLTELNLNDNRITGQGVSHLCNALKDVSCKLTELNLAKNKITDGDISLLSVALNDVNCKLSVLNLGINGITDQGVSHLVSYALRRVNCKLTKLDLAFNKMTDQGVSHLCYALKGVNSKLTELSLAKNKITDQGASHLCHALNDKNCKLTKLDLAKNNITDQGVSHLCDALKGVNCKLTALNLAENNITDGGVLCLCGALNDVNCKLTDLNIGKNRITNGGAMHLYGVLKGDNCKLGILNLSHTSITDQVLLRLSNKSRKHVIVLF
ncbi:uncharacterized protein LOC144640629 [Oculina patagonica]